MEKKKLVMASALAGLIAAGTMNLTANADHHEGKAKAGCKGKAACKGKKKGKKGNGCSGKDGCGGKDSCKGKAEGEAAAPADAAPAEGSGESH